MGPRSAAQAGDDHTVTTPAPTCPFCGTALATRLCLGYLHHFRCPRCPSASCYEVAGGQVRPVRCKGTTEVPKGDRCTACGGTGIKPTKADAAPLKRDGETGTATSDDVIDPLAAGRGPKSR
jgi:hypothetical protein